MCAMYGYVMYVSMPVCYVGDVGYACVHVGCVMNVLIVCSKYYVCYARCVRM